MNPSMSMTPREIKRQEDAFRAEVEEYAAENGLVLIDLDDWTQVDRLAGEFQRAVCRVLSTDAEDRRLIRDAAVDGLRRFAAPKPPEPKGLGAVVETPDGRYVRSDVVTCNPWRSPDGIPHEWDDLDGPMTVLSEGVEQP